MMWTPFIKFVILQNRNDVYINHTLYMKISLGIISSAVNNLTEEQ